MNSFNDSSPVLASQCLPPNAQHPSLYKIIPFNVKHGNCGGSLVQFQEGDELENALPFKIGKVLVSSGMQPDDVRGNHAHYETEEIVVALSGGCTFELDDGNGTRERVRLGSGNLALGSSTKQLATSNQENIKEALLLYPHIWRTFFDFEPGTVLLIVANIKYDETDYIRDREAFERIAQTWPGLGGSVSR